MCASSTLLTILLCWSRCCCGIVALLLCLRPNSTASKALLLCCHYAATTAKDFKLSLIYNYNNVIAIVLRPKCWSCTDTGLCCALELLLYKSAGNPGSAAVDYQPPNKMDNTIVPVAMMQQAIMNQSWPGWMRTTKPGGGGPKGSGSVLGCRQT